MALFFPKELETSVYAEDGYIKISQEEHGESVIVWLTRHQFDEMFNRSKHLYEELAAQK